MYAILSSSELVVKGVLPVQATRTATSPFPVEPLTKSAGVPPALTPVSVSTVLRAPLPSGVHVPVLQFQSAPGVQLPTTARAGSGARDA